MRSFVLFPVLAATLAISTLAYPYGSRSELLSRRAVATDLAARDRAVSRALAAELVARAADEDVTAAFRLERRAPGEESKKSAASSSHRAGAPGTQPGQAPSAVPNVVPNVATEAVPNLLPDGSPQYSYLGGPILTYTGQGFVEAGYYHAMGTMHTAVPPLGQQPMPPSPFPSGQHPTPPPPPPPGTTPARQTQKRGKKAGKK